MTLRCENCKYFFEAGLTACRHPKHLGDIVQKYTVCSDYKEKILGRFTKTDESGKYYIDSVDFLIDFYNKCYGPAVDKLAEYENLLEEENEK